MELPKHWFWWCSPACLPHRAILPSNAQIQNLVLSCAANAKQQGMKKSKLFISEIMADQV